MKENVRSTDFLKQSDYEKEYKKYRGIAKVMKQLEEDYEVAIPAGENSCLASLFVIYPAGENTGIREAVKKCDINSHEKQHTCPLEKCER
ncbi:hypothetical protein IW492_00885 [Enterococcus sp. BWB1-3]|uniref:hypothetical protein n=1 Tax=Enterococcus sp. BWB1-3 TaxID=2787713 RepID=UPI001920CBB3|nr:hypothetical protein [Enterococcus sp. BWB1-3]MBL1227784.1 hypothetical protein [Enterococcus sp. BWB1-3]